MRKSVKRTIVTKEENVKEIQDGGLGEVPRKHANFVPMKNFAELKSIIESRKFYPVFITGHSGLGKTFSVEQACAMTNRKFVCVSMTPETDESDLLGTYVLVNHSMVWRDGAVTQAARKGAVLCLDEIDYGGSNLSTLQRVLEGKPFLLKKKGEVVVPAPGFTIVATANTKGRGSDSGRYMYTNILNEAFLERFPVMFEQSWPTQVVETKILLKEAPEQKEFVTNLVNWAFAIRDSFDQQVITDTISTRRLVQIVQAHAIFGNRMKALTYCLNRFDEISKNAFLDLYTKQDATVSMANDKEESEQSAVVNG